MKEAAEYADVVFSGKVIAAKVISDFSFYGIKPTKNKENFYEFSMEGGLLAATIVLNKTYKGRISTDTVTVLTPRHGAACGVSIRQGEKWVIYGTREKDLSIGRTQSPNSKAVFFTNLCSGSSAYTNEAALLEEMLR